MLTMLYPRMHRRYSSFILFMGILGVLTCRFGFGLRGNERSVMSPGMDTRIVAAVLAAVLAIPNVDQRMVAMVVMWTLWSFILAQVISPMLGGRAGEPPAGAAS